MLHPYFQFTEGVAVVADDAFEYGATIMRASITNKAVSALVASAAALGGTMLATLNASTIMRANSVNGSGTMRADATNLTAELL